MPAIWTTPITWNVDQLVTNTDLNEQVRDNLEYLLSPNHQHILRDNGGNYSITNVTTFQDIDSANLSLTLETHGGPVYVHLMGSARSNGLVNHGYFDLTVDGTRLGAAHTLGLVTFGVDPQTWMPVSISVLVTGLSAGVHTFRPQWRTDPSDTLTLRGSTSDNPVIFEVIEL